MMVSNQTKTHLKVAAACLLASAVLTPSLIAAPASSLPRPASVAEGPAADGDQYLLGPDDVLTVTVLKHPEFSVANVAVPASGVVELPAVGTIRVTGKTLTQLDSELTARLRSRLKRPEVVVNLAKPRPRPVYVVGQVRTPGPVEFKNGWRVSQVLAAAGGLTISAEKAGVSVTRGKAKLLDVPVTRILNDPASNLNVPLDVNDVVQVFERVVNVQVNGAVRTPGSYAVPVGGGVVEAVGLAGGLTAEASLSRAVVRRAGGTEVPADLYKAIRLGDTAQNVKLNEGDSILVPQFKDRVSVLGAVRAPGFYGIEDAGASTVADVVSRAGGAAPGAALTRAILIRNGKETPLNLYRVLQMGDKAGNVVLMPDDVISVPVSRGVTVMGEVQRPGTYPLEEGMNPRVSDAIAQAGGLSIKPEIARISLSRSVTSEKQISMSIDAVGLLEQSDLSQNGRLQDGDIISVSAVKRVTVFVNGEIRAAGAYELQDGDSVPEVITRAGGPTDDAALSQVTLTRRSGEVVTVDLVASLRDGAAKVRVPLQDGDLVVVPRNANRVLVLGALNKPGSYPLPENRPLSVGDAIGLAGGARNLAKVKQIALLRQAPEGVQRRTIALDQANGKNLDINITLQSGDVLYVPEGKITGSIFGLALQAASAFSNFVR